MLRAAELRRVYPNMESFQDALKNHDTGIAVVLDGRLVRHGETPEVWYNIQPDGRVITTSPRVP
jgi:hypothetical protein